MKRKAVTLVHSPDLQSVLPPVRRKAVREDVHRDLLRTKADQHSFPGIHSFLQVKDLRKTNSALSLALMAVTRLPLSSFLEALEGLFEDIVEKQPY